MKKIAIRVLIAFVVLIILTVLAVGFFLDGAVKRGVEIVGSSLTKVEVKLNSASLSLLSGSGSIKGLLVGNPEGYKSASAIAVGSASLAVQPGSVFADKVVIKSIEVQAPEITFETNLRENNLSKILANLEASNEPASKESPPKESKSSKKLEVDDFIISGGKIHVSLTSVIGGKSITVPLPEIHLKDLGKDAQGITAAELTKLVLRTVIKSATEASAGAVAELSKQAADMVKGGKAAVDNAEKAAKGITDLFKKK